MSIKALELAWERGPRDPEQLLIFLAMADQAGYKHELFLDIWHLAQRSRLPQDTVRDHVARMTEAGWILNVDMSEEGQLVALCFAPKAVII